MTILAINAGDDMSEVIANRDRLMRGEIDNASRERQLLRKDGTLDLARALHLAGARPRRQGAALRHRRAGYPRTQGG